MWLIEKLIINLIENILGSNLSIIKLENPNGGSIAWNIRSEVAIEYLSGRYKIWLLIGTSYMIRIDNLIEDWQFNLE